MNSRVPFIAAPLLVLVYGVLRLLDGLDGEHGPGPAWTLGHVAFLLALGLFVPILLRLRRMGAPPGPVATGITVAGMAGLLGFAVQFGIDLYAGLVAADHAGMSAIFDRVQALPGVPLLVYAVGPPLFSLALFALVLRLALTRHAKPWTAVLILANALIPAIDLDLLPLAAVLALAAFISLTNPARTSPKPRPTRESSAVGGKEGGGGHA